MNADAPTSEAPTSEAADATARAADAVGVPAAGANTPDPDVRSRLAVALDVDDLDEAVRLAGAVSSQIGVAKVGLQLFSGYGPRAVEALRETGMDVFLDVKLHDIPNTVGAAARRLGALGVRYLTVHSGGGAAMLRAAVEGLGAGAERAGLPVPTTLAVLILTSHPDAPAELLRQRLDVVAAARTPGIVCAAPDLATVRAYAPGVLTVTPGIRLPGGVVHDQARVSTPGAAIADGADLLVLGRAVTAAADPAAAAAEVGREVRAALTARTAG
ncbi:MAG: orotidine-5'-phosphate decarboxylase [Kineosporiaceae bacterium]